MGSAEDAHEMRDRVPGPCGGGGGVGVRRAVYMLVACGSW